MVILICSSPFDRTILITYVLKLCDGNDTCKNDLFAQHCFCRPTAGCWCWHWGSCQVLFYSVRCQHISKINKAKKNRKNYMVGEMTPAFGKGWEMHSDVKSLYFISCILSCFHRIGSCISDWRLHCQSGESRWKFVFWQIITFPLGIICLRVNKALGVVNPHTDTFLAYPLLQSTLVCVHQHCLLPLARGNQVWW